MISPISMVDLFAEYFLKNTKSPSYKEGIIETPQTNAVCLHPIKDRSISNKFVEIFY